MPLGECREMEGLIDGMGCYLLNNDCLTLDCVTYIPSDASPWPVPSTLNCDKEP